MSAAAAEKFSVPDGWVVQGYRFALDPSPTQSAALESHAGAARFAYNTMLAVVKANLDQRSAERSYGVVDEELTPSVNWSFQGLRNDWNQRKHAVAVQTDGTPWWPENSKESYAGACKNLSLALSNWDKSRKGVRKGPRMGFPSFKSKHRAAKAFSFTTGVIRCEPDRHHVSLPVLGTMHTHESTRALSRRVEAGTARILKATVRLERRRWLVSFTCLVQRARTRPAHIRAGAAVVGVDVGVKDLIVVAGPGGTELRRLPAPRELTRATRTLRALQRRAARQHGPWDAGAKTRREPSAGWLRTQEQVRRAHARVANLRRDRTHKLTTELARTHTVIGAETLAVKNMMSRGGARKRGLNRSLADAGLGEVLRQLDYKSNWYGSAIAKADSWFPSSKTCSGCGVAKTKLHLHERVYECGECNLVIDRDLNAAINLARWAQQATVPSAGVVMGGADCKTLLPGDAGGRETRTVVTRSADPQGSAA